MYVYISNIRVRETKLSSVLSSDVYLKEICFYASSLSSLSLYCCNKLSDDGVREALKVAQTLKEVDHKSQVMRY